MSFAMLFAITAFAANKGPCRFSQRLWPETRGCPLTSTQCSGKTLAPMGMLALLTREMPAAIAVERKSLQKILVNALSKAGEVEKRMAVLGRGCYFRATVFTGSDCGVALMLKSAGGSATSASGL